MSKSTSAGTRYCNQFIQNIKRNSYVKFNLEEYQKILYTDGELGLQIYGSIDPSVNVHYSNQIFISVISSGKASRVKPVNSIVASVLTTQRTRKSEICDALAQSARDGGRWAVTKEILSSQVRCGECGHEPQAYQNGGECCDEDEDNQNHQICCECYGIVAAVEYPDALSLENIPKIPPQNQAQPAQIAYGNNYQAIASYAAPSNSSNDNYNNHIYNNHGPTSYVGTPSNDCGNRTYNNYGPTTYYNPLSNGTQEYSNNAGKALDWENMATSLAGQMLQDRKGLTYPEPARYQDTRGFGDKKSAHLLDEYSYQSS